jgi:hypothetical protein
MGSREQELEQRTDEAAALRQRNWTVRTRVQLKLPRSPVQVVSGSGAASTNMSNGVTRAQC